MASAAAAAAATASSDNDACCLIRRPAQVSQTSAPEQAQPSQVAIITGCASGIGRGTALAFAALNYKLVLVDKQADKLAETASLCAQKSSKNYKVSLTCAQLSTLIIWPSYTIR